MAGDEVLTEDLTTSPLPIFTNSSPKQWEKMGMKLLGKNLFRNAALCFNRAGMREKAHYCLGKLCVREAVDNESHEIIMESKEKLLEAACHFVKAGHKRIKIAAKCLLKCRETQLAAQVLEKGCHVSVLRCDRATFCVIVFLV